MRTWLHHTNPEAEPPPWQFGSTYWVWLGLPTRWRKPTLRTTALSQRHGEEELMGLPDDETERMLQEECPGPPDLESALIDETVSSAISHPPLVMDAKTSLAEVLSCMREADRGGVLDRERWKAGRHLHRARRAP
jgi:hypothetical protein